MRAFIELLLGLACFSFKGSVCVEMRMQLGTSTICLSLTLTQQQATACECVRLYTVPCTRQGGENHVNYMRMMTIWWTDWSYHGYARTVDWRADPYMNLSWLGWLHGEPCIRHEWSAVCSVWTESPQHNIRVTHWIQLWVPAEDQREPMVTRCNRAAHGYIGFLLPGYWMMAY
jgi:hypothetical protein